MTNGHLPTWHCIWWLTHHHDHEARTRDGEWLLRDASSSSFHSSEPFVSDRDDWSLIDEFGNRLHDHDIAVSPHDTDVIEKCRESEASHKTATSVSGFEVVRDVNPRSYQMARK